MFGELVGRAVLCTPFGSTGNGAHGMTRRTCAIRARPKAKRSLLNVDTQQSGGAFARHESACPTVAGIKELFVAPKHSEIRAGGLFPPNLVVNVPLP